MTLEPSKMSMCFEVMKEFSCKDSSAEGQGILLLHTDNLDIRGKNGSRSWITSLGPEKGTMKCTFSMKASCGPFAIIFRSRPVYRRG